MAHFLEFDGNRFVIADYLVVYPFGFDNQGRLLAEPHRARAFFNLVATQVSQGQDRQRQTRTLAGIREFAVTNQDERILDLQQFEARVAGTPASLDMSLATWVLSGMQVSNVSVAFTPGGSQYPLFNANRGGRAHWGAELCDEGGQILLRASLSAPVYRIQDPTWISEYFALGPANSGSQGGAPEDVSIFQRMVSLGLPPIPDGGGVVAQPTQQPLDTFTVKDLTNDVSCKFFGDDADGIAQVGSPTLDSKGAVFVTNGRATVRDLRWRALAKLIKHIASADTGDDVDQELMASFPSVREIDQTVNQTAVPETRTTGQFTPTTPDYEGIALWNLEQRGNDQVDFLHR